MPIEIWDARYLTAEQALALGDLIHQTWPKPHMSPEGRAAQLIELGRAYSGEPGPPPRAIVALDEGRVVAHAAIFPRVIGTEWGDVLVGGLARVCTDAAMRGRGLGEAVVRAAFGLVDAGDYQFSLFQTKRSVQPFYAKFGCVLVDNRIINPLAEDPAANPFWDEIVMRYPGDKSWPSGTIDLRGPGY